MLVWLVHTDDKRIDEREICEIQLLMTQRRCGVDVRNAARGHLENPDSLDARKQIDHPRSSGRGCFRCLLPVIGAGRVEVGVR